MALRIKLFLMFALGVLAAVGLVAWGVTRYTEQAFEQSDRARTDAVIAQIRREFDQRAEAVAASVQSIADAEATLRMALELSQPQADPSLYVNDARGLAGPRQLDFLEFVSDAGTVISSAQWPARVGYRNDWVTAVSDWNSRGAFLQRVELPSGLELGILAVRMVPASDQNLYIIGGQRFDTGFLDGIVLTPGMRVLFYSNLEAAFVPSALEGPEGPVQEAGRLQTLVDEARREGSPAEGQVEPPGEPSGERFTAMPLPGRSGDVLAVLLVGSSQQDLILQTNYIRGLSLVVAGGGIVFAFLVSGWVGARITKPLRRLSTAMREVAGGNWDARLEGRTRGEAGRVAEAFREMTEQLPQRRERMIHAERVAAWREVAQRLGHEIKAPLFPLEVTLENLARAREQTPERFDEAFFESMAAMRTDLEALKGAVARCSGFAKTPPPRLRPVRVNDALRAAVQRFEPRFSAIGRPPVTPELFLDESVESVQADPDRLGEAFDAILLRSLDTMPGGGTLAIRTAQRNGVVRVEIADSGRGLRAEECSRLFTPYYATQQHASDLGLATAESILSDHGARLAVESAPGAGTIYRIEFPPVSVVQPPEKESAALPEARPRRPFPELPPMSEPSPPAGDETKS